MSSDSSSGTTGCHRLARHDTRRDCRISVGYLRFAENARLTALLEAHGIEWRQPPEPSPPGIAEPEPSRLSTAEK